PGRKALERFRQLAELRRDLVWPLAASPCLDARSSRTGSALIVTWAFAAGHLTMALNPASSPVAVTCTAGASPVSVGTWSQDGETLRLGAWTALVWTEKGKG